MSKVQEVVNILLSEIDQKKSKIQGKIDSLSAQAVSEKTNINQMTRQLIDLEMAEDTRGQAALIKKIAQARENHEDIAGRITAYTEALNDTGFIMDKLPGIIKIGRQQQEAWAKNLQDKSSRKAELQKELESLSFKIQVLSNEIQIDSQRGRSVDRALTPLLKRIESRPLKSGYEFEYLEHLSNGESIDSLLDIPRSYSTIPEQSFGIPAPNPWKQEDKPRPVGNLMRSEHRNY